MEIHVTYEPGEVEVECPLPCRHGEITFIDAKIPCPCCHGTGKVMVHVPTLEFDYEFDYEPDGP